MLKHHRRTVAAFIGLTLFALAPMTHAQYDVNPPRPNVLLLVDSSGSMEYKTSTNTLPKCDPTGTTSEKSRWIDLVEVLTGTIPDYRCQTIERNSTDFQNEYRIASASPVDKLNPRDYLYPIPYHRPMSGTCAPTPGLTDATARFCRYNASKPCTSSADVCEFPNATGGLLDAFSTEVRFGLMTFDTLPDPSTDMVGTWSYIWGSKALGAPVGCTALADQEVGARNAKAPVWEGRMVAFGPSLVDGEVDMLRTRNDLIQKILLSSRPFGATPLAGMLRDAQDFFWNDPDPDGSGNTAPKDDPFVKGSCRDNFIIILTDGEPNMDLRPHCQGVNPVCGNSVDACCPFQKPEDIAYALANDSSKPKVKTYVVGFAVSTAVTDAGTTVPCQNLTLDDLTKPTGLCATNTASSLQICCRLNRIAYNGGTNNAYFASTVEGLRSALATVLSETSKGTTSRTIPVFASATGSSSGSSTFRFYTSFVPRIDTVGLWQGVIERQRYVCGGSQSTPEKLSISEAAGDEFVSNVNAANSKPRVFHSVIGTTNAGAIDSTRTIRAQAQRANARDGLSDYSGSAVTGGVTTFPGTVPPAAVGVASTPCIAETNATTTYCRDRYLNWLVGATPPAAPTGSSTNAPPTYHRCPDPGATTCNLVADVYHSVPAVVGNPKEDLRDEGYLLFSRGDARKRPIVLYVSTNDGILHAFKVASNDPDDTTPESKVLTKYNNELWAFVPPAVLPRVPSEYPNVHQFLLDGAPVVRDVAGTVPSSGDDILLERDTKTIATPNSDWRTILVQSFGGSYPGYFALDVTNPVAGPKFLWQLTTDKAGNPLFGDGGGTPTIATLYFDPDGSGPREIPVALLPGGTGGAPPSPNVDCARADTSPSTVFDTSIKPRTRVPCYEDDSGTSNRVAARRARSLTIVRLDTGEIVRSFRRTLADAPESIRLRVTESKIDSPITGQPVAYPGWTGAIADRAYVGDRDGSLWRLDLSSTSPSNWTMKLFFDAYTNKTSHSGQPIATAPVLSTNETGDVVVLFSTGSQDDLLGTAQSENFIYSVREVATYSTTTTETTITPKVNWYRLFTDGNRVTGPLTLFSSNVYFSTYTPPATSNACNSGTSSIWGMHYINRQVEGDASKGGAAALPKSGDPANVERVQELQPDGTLIAAGSTIFGIGLAQIQGCFQTGAAVSDPYFGGTYYPITASSTASYELVVQTGRAGAASTGAATNTATIALPPPNITPRISGWTLVLE